MIKIERLHGVEQIFGGGALLFQLVVDAPRVGAGPENDHGEKRDEPLVLAPVAGLHDRAAARRTKTQCVRSTASVLAYR
jgi:hypothetical protein